MYDYSIFVDRIKSNINSGMENEPAVDEAIDWAIKQNLLEGFIKEQRAEVKMNILTDFDQEKYDRSRRREGFEEGITQGAQQKAVVDAITLIQKYKATPEAAAKDMNAPLELVLEELKKIS